MKDNEPIRISSGTLVRAFNAVHRVASKDETRSHLNAVALDIWSDHIRTSATDGHMAALYEEKTETHMIPGTHVRYLLMLSDVSSVLDRLIKLVKKHDYSLPIFITPGDGEIVLTCNYTIAGLQTVNEDFPPLDKIIPSTGLKPNFTDNVIGTRTDIIITAMKCFEAVDSGDNFTVWEFNGELDPIVLSKRYNDYDSVLTVLVMPAKVDPTMGRPDHEQPQQKADK